MKLVSNTTLVNVFYFTSHAGRVGRIEEPQRRFIAAQCACQSKGSRTDGPGRVTRNIFEFFICTHASPLNIKYTAPHTIRTGMLGYVLLVYACIQSYIFVLKRAYIDVCVCVLVHYVCTRACLHRCIVYFSLISLANLVRSSSSSEYSHVAHALVVLNCKACSKRCINVFSVRGIRTHARKRDHVSDCIRQHIILYTRC